MSWRLGLSLVTNHGVSGVCNMSLGLWYAGVELGGGGRRRGEGQVRMCYADVLRVVKDGCEAWMMD